MYVRGIVFPVGLTYCGILFASPVIEPIPCPLSQTTLEHVQSCPENNAMLKKRAEMKQCSNVQQNCTEASNFVYHCVPVQKSTNDYVEVCAPATFIAGYDCTEYNYGGSILQPGRSCKHCAFRYISSNASFYQECYAGPDTTPTSTDKKTTTEFTTNDKKTSDRELPLVLLVLLGATPVIVIVFAAILFAPCIIRRQQSKKNNKTYLGTTEGHLKRHLETTVDTNQDHHILLRLSEKHT